MPKSRLTNTFGPRIILFDDNFPNLLSGFRVAEYNFYFDVFPQLLVACSTSDLKEYAASYNALYDEYSHRYVDMSDALGKPADLCYVNFLNNAFVYLPYIEALAAPFVFTLYPGGGFELDSPAARKKLSRVLSSPLLRGVISTQRITSVVLREMDCPVAIHDIYGAAINPIYTSSVVDNSDLSRKGDRLAICFAAFNYGDHGRSKGYPEFIAAAEILAEQSTDIELSVVGNYSHDDVTLSSHLRSRLRFHGPLNTQHLRQFFLTQDMIVSPNAPFRVTGAQFDGFPTATCVEASLCGVAMVCADELGLNTHYAADEIIICETDHQSILNKVQSFLNRPDELRQIGERGRMKSLRLFSAAAQLVSRAQVLREAAVHRGRPAWQPYGSADRYISAS